MVQEGGFTLEIHCSGYIGLMTLKLKVGVDSSCACDRRDDRIVISCLHRLSLLPRLDCTTIEIHALCGSINLYLYLKVLSSDVTEQGQQLPPGNFYSWSCLLQPLVRLQQRLSPEPFPALGVLVSPQALLLGWQGHLSFLCFGFPLLPEVHLHHSSHNKFWQTPTEGTHTESQNF